MQMRMNKTRVFSLLLVHIDTYREKTFKFGAWVHGKIFNQSAVGTFGSKVNDICTKGQRVK